MSLAVQITIANAANLLKQHLDLWANPRGGTVKVMANLRHLWEEVFVVAETSAPRILICYTGEIPRGGVTSNTLYRVDRQWMVVVVRGHGFKNLMAEPEGESEIFYDSVETIRDLIRVLLNISDEEEVPNIVYKGIKPLPSLGPTPTANVFLDAFSIEFTTANDIPAVTATAPGQ